MKKIFLCFISSCCGNALAEGFYYPVPANPPGFVYALPPAYIVPPQQVYVPPPIYVQPIQRGYYPPPPNGWADSKIVPLPPKFDLSPKN